MNNKPPPDTHVKTDWINASRPAGLQYDPSTWIGTVEWIKPKDGPAIKLQANTAQKKLQALVMKMRLEGRPVRIIILKPRQVGMSTWIQGLFYEWASRVQNIRTITVAHDSDSTRELFAKTRYFQQCWDRAPDTVYSNRTELSFKGPLNSSMVVQTAGRGEIARGQTFQAAHLSEMAFYEEAEKVTLSVMQSVPSSPETMVFIETTANGMGNYFHKEWLRACRKSPEDMCEWEPFFFAWFEEPSYCRKLPAQFSLTAEEQTLKQRFSLANEQLCWRRWCIATNCGGDSEKFKQEYPATPEEAFLASGRPVFNMEQMQKWLEASEVEKPKTGWLKEDPEHNVVFIEDSTGPLKVYREPHPLGQYSMGTDVAEGGGGDASGTVVLHKRTLLDVADLHSRYLAPEELARQTNLLRRWYNNPLDCPDVTGVGQAFLQEYKKLTGRIYRQQIRDEQTDRIREELGYRISGMAARTLLVTQYVAAIREGIIRKQLCKEAILEHMTFVWKQEGSYSRAEHQDGCLDDHVFKRMLAYQAALQEPYYTKRTLKPGEKPPVKRGASVPGVPEAVHA